MVEMVWSGKIDIHIGNGMKVMGRDRYLHGKDSFPILFSFFSLSLFLSFFFSSFSFLLSFCLLLFFISDLSSLFLLLVYCKVLEKNKITFEDFT